MRYAGNNKNMIIVTVIAVACLKERTYRFLEDLVPGGITLVCKPRRPVSLSNCDGRC